MRIKQLLIVLFVSFFLCSSVLAAGSKFDRSATDAETTAQARDDVWLSPSNISSISSGVINKFQLDHNTETLNADRTILTTDKPVQFLDANGADRNVTLPAEASSADLVFTFYNDSDGAGEDLIIKDDTPTTLITIGPGQGIDVSCDGISWKVLNDKGIYYDGVNGNMGIGTTGPGAKLDVYGDHVGGIGLFRMTGTTFAYATYDAASGYNSGFMLDEAGANRWYVASEAILDSFEIASRIGGDIVRFKILQDGKIGIGTSSPDTLLELQKESADAEETISVYHDTEATAPIITMRKADNNATAPALVDDNAVLGRINFKGHDGSGWHTGAKIEARVDGTPSDGTDMPTELVFSTTADGAGSTTDHFRIAPNGDVETLHREILKPTTFEFTTEVDITDPLPTSVVLLSGDNDSDNDAIDLQDGETVGQVLYLIASINIDADDTCTINYGDTTCTNCPATVFNKVGENAHLVWTGSTWVVISLQDAL